MCWQNDCKLRSRVSLWIPPAREDAALSRTSRARYASPVVPRAHGLHARGELVWDAKRHLDAHSATRQAHRTLRRRDTCRAVPRHHERLLARRPPGDGAARRSTKRGRKLLDMRRSLMSLHAQRHRPLAGDGRRGPAHGRRRLAAVRARHARSPWRTTTRPPARYARSTSRGSSLWPRPARATSRRRSRRDGSRPFVWRVRLS